MRLTYKKLKMEREGKKKRKRESVRNKVAL